MKMAPLSSFFLFFHQELENSLKKIRRKRNNSKKARVDSPRV